MKNLVYQIFLFIFAEKYSYMFTQLQISDVMDRYPDIVDYPALRHCTRSQKAVLIRALRSLWLDPVDHVFYGAHRPTDKDLLEFQYAIASYDLDPHNLCHG